MRWLRPYPARHAPCTLGASAALSGAPALHPGSNGSTVASARLGLPRLGGIVACGRNQVVRFESHAPLTTVRQRQNNAMKLTIAGHAERLQLIAVFCRPLTE